MAGREDLTHRVGRCQLEPVRRRLVRQLLSAVPRVLLNRVQLLVHRLLDVCDRRLRRRALRGICVAVPVAIPANEIANAKPPVEKEASAQMTLPNTAPTSASELKAVASLIRCSRVPCTASPTPAFAFVRQSLSRPSMSLTTSTPPPVGSRWRSVSCPAVRRTVVRQVAYRLRSASDQLGGRRVAGGVLEAKYGGFGMPAWPGPSAARSGPDRFCVTSAVMARGRSKHPPTEYVADRRSAGLRTACRHLRAASWW